MNLIEEFFLLVKIIRLGIINGIIVSLIFLIIWIIFNEEEEDNK